MAMMKVEISLAGLGIFQIFAELLPKIGYVNRQSSSCEYVN